MRIAIIGAGSVANARSSLAQARRGCDLGARNPAIRNMPAPKERHKPPAEAAEAPDRGSRDARSATEGSQDLGSLAGKIVIDCTNPLGMGADGLQLVLGFGTPRWLAGRKLGTGCVRLQTLNDRRRQHGEAADYR
jgi:hypothetical protein